ncbi:hypothetical protein CEXT_126421 [Caerostris extrusa]|uniref:Uncharacterized protein n=1 Tax=Caerostris extrusa TaxID=172846 RepID=A0AAV4NUE6_CAEEX|nr:hypothetical protein CEXT_126421 [Caerostris extrusa]
MPLSRCGSNRSEENSLQQPRPPPTEQSALWRGGSHSSLQRIKRNAAFIDEFGGGLAHPRSCSKCTSVFHVRKEPSVHFCSDAALLCGRGRHGKSFYRNTRPPPLSHSWKGDGGE